MDPQIEDLLEEGIRSFNAGHYFEAHERWEDLWRQTHGPLRLFYQGLIQAAVGLHHLNRGNRHGAPAQIGKPLQKQEHNPSTMRRPTAFRSSAPEPVAKHPTCDTVGMVNRERCPSG